MKCKFNVHYLDYNNCKLISADRALENFRKILRLLNCCRNLNKKNRKLYILLEQWPSG